MIRVTLNENIINISRKEFDILQLLASAPGKVFSREMSLRIGLGVKWDGFERMIDSHIKRIRSKLEKNSARLRNGLKPFGELVIDFQITLIILLFPNKILGK